MTDNIIKQVPCIIENPIVVMRSKNINSHITMFGEVYSNNKPVLVVLELSPVSRKGLKLDELKIASAYGKDKAQNFINSSEILYVESNKKRVSDWEKRTRLQLPMAYFLLTLLIVYPIQPKMSSKIQLKHLISVVQFLMMKEAKSICLPC